jgi:hypothetical protein
MKLQEVLKDFIKEILAEKRMREADVTGGKKVPWGDKEHITDLEHRISELSHWRDKQKRGSESRANYSRLISRLKGELASAKRKLKNKRK